MIKKFDSNAARIKRHYRVINTVCGIFLIVSGVFMMLGIFGKLIGGLI